MDWKWLNITMRLIIVNHQAMVSIISLSSFLVMKAPNEPMRNWKKVRNIVHNENLTLNVVIEVAHRIREQFILPTLPNIYIFPIPFSFLCLSNNKVLYFLYFFLFPPFSFTCNQNHWKIQWSIHLLCF